MGFSLATAFIAILCRFPFGWIPLLIRSLFSTRALSLFFSLFLWLLFQWRHTGTPTALARKTQIRSHTQNAHVNLFNSQYQLRNYLRFSFSVFFVVIVLDDDDDDDVVVCLFVRFLVSTNKNHFNHNEQALVDVLVRIDERQLWQKQQKNTKQLNISCIEKVTDLYYTNPSTHPATSKELHDRLIFFKTIDAKHGPKADCTMSTCDFTIHICLIHCNIILCLCECECELVHIMYMNSDWNSLILILLMKNTRTHLANTRPRIHTQFDVFFFRSFI